MKLVIVGAGALGRLMLESIRLAGAHDVVGFVSDHDPADEVQGLPILCSCENLASVRSSADGAAIAIGNNHDRRQLAAAAREALFELPAIIDPTSMVSPSAAIADGAFIAPMAVVGPGVRVEAGGVIGTAAVIEHDAVVEEFASVGPRVLVDARARVGALAKVPGGAVLRQDEVYT
jgi:UDP-3-O-[3-hydroxymyristoyl] glucosamine N-acyltransferase